MALPGRQPVVVLEPNQRVSGAAPAPTAPRSRRNHAMSHLWLEPSRAAQRRESPGHGLVTPKILWRAARTRATRFGLRPSRWPRSRWVHGAGAPATPTCEDLGLPNDVER